MNLASTRRNWPTGRGFERFYGFLGAETNQWYPDLVYDSHPVDPPRTPEEGYHFDRGHHRQGAGVHQGRQGARARQAVLPLLRAGRLPRAAPRARRSGSTASRAASTWATRRCASRRSPARRRWGSSRPTPSCRRSTRSARRRPAPGPNGEPFPALDYTRPWDSLSAEEQRLFSRMAEVYAGFLAHADAPDRAAAGLPGGDRPAREHDGRSWSPTTAPAARAARTARSTRTSSSTASPTTSPRTWRCSTSSAARRPTTTTPTAGRWRSTRRSRCGSATSSTAARRTRASSPGRRASRPRASSASSTTTPIDLVPTILDALGVEPPETIGGPRPEPLRRRQHALQLRRRDAAQRPRDAVLLDARLAQHLARRLEGRHHPPDAQRLEPLRRGHLGALPHRRRPLRAARPRRRGARAAAAS